MNNIKLSDVAEILNGYAFKSKNYVSKGIRVIRIANVQNGYICDEKPCFYPVETQEEIQQYMLREGDLLVSLTGNVGRVGILHKDMLPAALNQRVCCIRINENYVLTKYLYFYFMRSQFIRECISASSGVAQLNLSPNWLKKKNIPVPPIEEQRRIVSRIEELFSELDSAVETLQKTRQQLEIYRQAVLKEAFENIDIRNYVKLGKIIEKPRYGTSKKCTYDATDSSTAVYRIPNINYEKGILDRTDLKYAEFDSNELNGIDLKENDILLIRSNGSVSLVGRTAIVNKKDVNSTFAGYLIRIRLFEPSTLKTKFLHYYLQSYQARYYIENTAKSTSGVNNINAEEIKKLVVPNCDDEFIAPVISNIESRLSVCAKIERTVDEALQQAEAMRQSILKKAFEGEL